MKKVFILIFAAFMCTTIQGQTYYEYKDGVVELKEPEDEIVMGDYHFKCYEYSKVKGGGKYFLGRRFELEEYKFFLLATTWDEKGNREKILKKYNLYVKDVGSDYIEAYDYDRYRDWQTREINKREERRKEIEKSFGI